MIPAGTERRRQLVTAGVGAALVFVMGAVLLVGFRLATHMRTDISALQTASRLQNYPVEIARQLNALRDRLEGNRAVSPAQLLSGLRRPS